MVGNLQFKGLVAPFIVQSDVIGMDERKLLI